MLTNFIQLTGFKIKDIFLTFKFKFNNSCTEPGRSVTRLKMMQLLDPSSAAAAIFELIGIVTHSSASRLESYNVSHLWRMAMICNIQCATKTALSIWELYCNVPSGLSRHLNHIFINLNVLLIAAYNHLCVFSTEPTITHCCRSKHSVINHLINGWPLYPSGTASKTAGITEFANVN